MKRVRNLLASVLLLASLLLPLAPVSAATTNLINNPSAETLTGTAPANWTSDSWGTNTSSLSVASTGHTGSHSLYATMSGRTNGDAKWVPDSAAVSANTSYTFSDYYQSNVATEIDLQYTSTTGAVSYAYVGAVNPSATWQSYNATFTTPSNVAKVAVLHLLAANGWLQTDDYSLAPTVTVTPGTNNDGNLVANPSFEVANGTAPAAWTTGSWGTNNAAFAYNTTGHTGSHSATVSVSSYTSGDAKWIANPVSVTPGTSYTYSDFYQSTATSYVVAMFTSTTGTVSYVDLSNAATSSAWNSYTSTFVAPANAANVTIYHLLQSVGKLTIDDVSILPVVVVPNSNLVPNNSVEQSNNATSPNNWETNSWGTNTAAFTYVKSGHTGSRSLKVTVSKYTSGDAKWYFDPITTLTPGAGYNFNFWYQTNSQPHVVAMYTDAAGNTTYSTLATPLPASNAATTWQQYATTFDVPTSTVSVSMLVLLSSNGWLQTDDYSITPYSPVGFARPLVSLTFDDGWDSIYTNGFPILQKYNFPSTQYLISGTLNTPTYMTTAEALAMKTAGNEIGSHTVTHPFLTQLTSGQLKTELGQSQTTLRQLFGSDVATDFASPYGDYNKTVLTAIPTYYQSHRSTDEGFNSKDSFNRYNIKVQDIGLSTTPAQVASWVNEAIANKTWLVLVFHQVEAGAAATGDSYAVSPADLDTELAQIKSTGVTVETIAQGLNEVLPQVP